jgi:hypothetical protein
MDTVRSSETSVNFYQTALRHISEDGALYDVFFVHRYICLILWSDVFRTGAGRGQWKQTNNLTNQTINYLTKPVIGEIPWTLHTLNDFLTVILSVVTVLHFGVFLVFPGV